MATTMIQHQFSHKVTKLKKIGPRVFCAIETNVGFQYQNEDFRPADAHRLQHKCMQLNLTISAEENTEGKHVE